MPIQRTEHVTGVQLPLKIVTRYQERDSDFFPDRTKGWYWWLSVTAPTGADLVGVMRGPFITEDRALDDAHVNVGLAHA